MLDVCRKSGRGSIETWCRPYLKYSPCGETRGRGIGQKGEKKNNVKVAKKIAKVRVIFFVLNVAGGWGIWV